MTVNGDDFTYITGLVRDEAAIVLESGKEYLVESRLSPLVRSEGLSSIADLVVRLKDSGHWPLRRKVVDALTTNETLFFRDLDPFEAIKKEVLPELIEKRQFERRLVIWSAACSSGQEACSLAILIKENFPVLESWNVKIVGTDICSAVLNKAKSGEYSQVEVNRGLPANYLIKHFSKEGLNWKVKDHIKRMVEFREFNLISNDWNQLPRFDLVMLRNVLIYFSTETKQGILANVRRILAPDGCLFLGAAETTLGIDPGYNRSVCGKTSYYRPGAG